MGREDAGSGGFSKFADEVARRREPGGMSAGVLEAEILSA